MVREALTHERLRAMPVDEAAALFAVRRAEGLTANEQAMLDEWLAADPAHGRAFALTERSWQAFGDAGEDEILAAMRAHALMPRERAGPRWPHFAAAAAVLIAALIGSFWLFLPNNRAPQAEQLAWSRYEAAPDRMRTVTLADGSMMSLDAGSVAETRFSAKGRDIRLTRGRALFEVSHDPTRPFGVTASTRRVVALGTRFAIDLRDDTLKVMLLRGKVALEPVGEKASTVMLTPGQQFIERDGAASVHVLAAPADPAWSRGLIDLDDVPLAGAIVEINRYAPKPIVIRDPAVAALRVSGQFRAGDATRFAATVAELHALRVVSRDREIELARK